MPTFTRVKRRKRTSLVSKPFCGDPPGEHLGGLVERRLARPAPGPRAARRLQEQQPAVPQELLKNLDVAVGRDDPVRAAQDGQLRAAGG
jgi:hypothetical protein